MRLTDWCHVTPLQVAQAIKAVDKVVGQLMNGLKQLGLLHCINVVVVADHGNVSTMATGK